MDPQLIQSFSERVVTDLAAAYSGVLVNLGHKLGLYRAMAGAGPLTPEALAERTGTRARYVREWLNNQYAGGYVEYDADTRRYRLPDEHAHLLADEASPMFFAPAFDGASSIWLDEDKSAEVFRSGRGMAWGEHHHRLFHATEAFFRNGYRDNLTATWIPSLGDIAERLAAGGRVADVGCGHGVSSVLLAQAYPRAEVVAIDVHGESLDVARRRAREAGVEARIVFQQADARSFTGRDYDLICFMDSFHDMGDPHLAAAHAREALAVDGALMLVEPFARDRVEDNVGPVARLYYAASTTMCTPNALSQGEHALGAQAGQAVTEGVLRRAGFSRVRRTFETPFNLVIEARR